MRRVGFIALASAALVALPIASQAQSSIPSKQVQFPKGSTGTSIKGSLKGRSPDARDYVLGAKAGQTMTVSMQTTSNAAYFNVMAPGSTGEAIFAGELTGQNSWSGTLPTDGKYTIRVYLNRAASRQGATANFTINVAIKGASASGSSSGSAMGKAPASDAKVAGTNYHATGKLPCAMGTAPAGSSQCDFGVTRGSSGNAKVDVTPAGGLKRTLVFAGSKVSVSGGGKIKATKNGDEWSIEVNDYEHYQVPDAVINGG